MEKRRKFLLYLVLIFIVFLYFYLIIYTDFNDFLIYKLNSKYTENKINNIEEKILFTSLNKIVYFNDTISNKEETIIRNIVNVSKEKQDPIVYIYNSHDTEKYTTPFSSGFSIVPSVKTASYILKDYLNDYGISSYVEDRKISDYLNKNKLSYYYCYDASRHYMKDAMKNNDFKIYIDIHRDSTKYNKTLFEKDNKKYAKVMFVLAKKNKNYKENEKFVKYLNDSINKKYKGLSRGILNRTDVIFNQDISKNAILIELGGVDNTIEEINNTLSVIASILYEYISSEEINGE